MNPLGLSSSVSAASRRRTVIALFIATQGGARRATPRGAPGAKLLPRGPGGQALAKQGVASPEPATLAHPPRLSVELRRSGDRCL